MHTFCILNWKTELFFFFFIRWNDSLCKFIWKILGFCNSDYKCLKYNKLLLIVYDIVRFLRILKLRKERIHVFILKLPILSRILFVVSQWRIRSEGANGRLWWGEMWWNEIMSWMLKFMRLTRSNPWNLLLAIFLSIWKILHDNFNYFTTRVIINFLMNVQFYNTARYKKWNYK